MVPILMQPTVTSSAASASAPDPRSHSQFQIPKQGVLEGDTAPHHLHPQNQEWSPVAPLIPSDGQQAPSRSRPAVPSSHATRMHSTADGSTHETGPIREFVGRPGGNSDVPNSIEAQPLNLGVTTSNPAVMSINLDSSSSTPPSSQQGPAQSILLAPEEKSIALYTMRGLAASIKRSLNVERLAASAEPSA
ncbi:hypothetical protein BJV78DRAFT_1288308 [Lactifluus subvellereus]|nr:hypothetical protein BJV78DRAFT_1288308 [Lactifluus subvellereus]